MTSNHTCFVAYFIICAHHNDRLGKYLHFVFRKPDHIYGQTKREKIDNMEPGFYATNDCIPSCGSQDINFFDLILILA